MNTLISNVHNELSIIFYYRKTWLFLTLTAIIPSILALTLSNTETSVLSTSNFMIAMLWLFTTLILPYLIFMLSADLFTGEVAMGTIKLVLTRPISRWKVFCSKIIAMNCVIVVFILVLWGVTQLSTGFLQSSWIFNEASFNEAIQSLLIYLIASVPLFVLGIFSIWIAQFLRSVTGVLVLCMVIYTILKLIPFIVPSVGTFLFTTYTDWYTLWLGETIPWGELISISITLLASGCLFFVGGLYRFENKDV
jgi:ABC-2 type transport system permease protein